MFATCAPDGGLSGERASAVEQEAEAGDGGSEGRTWAPQVKARRCLERGQPPSIANDGPHGVGHSNGLARAAIIS